MTCISDEKDLRCVRRTLEGDTNAFEEIVTRYQRSVFNAVYHMVRDREDALEISQTVFMKAFASLAQFDPKRRFFSWMYRIAMNESINFVAARRTFQPMEPSMAGGARDPEERAASEELRLQLMEALATLPAEQRAVVVVRHVLGCSYHEAAEVLGVPEKTVKSRLFSARRSLRDALIARGHREGSSSHA